MKVKVEEKEGLRCSFCRDSKLKGRLIGCERCGTIVHEECWDSNKGCPTPACGRSIVVGRGQAPAPVPPTVAVPHAGIRFMTWFLDKGQRARFWWEDFLLRHPRYGRLDWDFLTGMMMFMGVMLAIIPVIIVAYGIHYRVYSIGEARGLLAFMPALGGLAIVFGHQLRSGT